MVVAEGEMDTGSSSPGTPPSLLLFTDASQSGWGTDLQDLTAFRMWSPVEKDLHINILGMKAILLALPHPLLVRK